MWYPKNKWQPCLRRGCLRPRRHGWPLCFHDWDELPAETRQQLKLRDGRQGEREVELVRQLSMKTPLEKIRMELPARPAKAKRR